MRVYCTGSQTDISARVRITLVGRKNQEQAENYSGYGVARHGSISDNILGHAITR